ncbi:hypothetical protein F5Y15DRAFT_428320 [Xylariaceae sp. FL0016]|nr:hypothetical protein F5Y15DRAFT_428320 [Xylariaceae sp. FL0016]
MMRRRARENTAPAQPPNQVQGRRATRGSTGTPQPQNQAQGQATNRNQNQPPHNRRVEPYSTLKRPGSHWRLKRPGLGHQYEAAPDGTYNLALYVRGLAERGGGGLREDFGELFEAYAQRLQIPLNYDDMPPGPIRDLYQAFVGARVLEARDYVRRGLRRSADATETLRAEEVTLKGNESAGELFKEIRKRDNKTLWTKPLLDRIIVDDLDDWLSKLVNENYLHGWNTFGNRLNPLFDWAKHWAEVRYRFLNHALQDDPDERRGAINTGRGRAKGNSANKLVHESNIENDCWLVNTQIVGSYGFNAQDRLLFQSLCRFAPEDAQQLSTCMGSHTGLPSDIPPLFDYIASFINEFINWRVSILENARLAHMRDPTVLNAASQRQRDTAQDNLFRAFQPLLQRVDNLYRRDLVPCVNQLVTEARGPEKAVHRTSFNTFCTTASTLGQEVQNSPANTYRGGRVPRYATGFPGIIGTRVPRPTGTSMVTQRNTRTRNSPA